MQNQIQDSKYEYKYVRYNFIQFLINGCRMSWVMQFFIDSDYFRPW